MNRRDLIAGSATAAFGGIAHAAAARAQPTPRGAMLSAATFGAVGDGVRDDTRALQAALDAAFRKGGPGVLTIPPGAYRVSRPLTLAFSANTTGKITHRTGIFAAGARLVSSITDGGNVLHIISRTVARFLVIDGLEISGSGRDGHGLYLECIGDGRYLYNFCLRDVVVQGCGGDGCRMIGNVFEGQVFNAYFRDNKRNGATFGHGKKKGILSAIHVFGSVFGGNGVHGAELINGCYDVSFTGCYLLLNGRFGLSAPNGCTLLSNCGFENNHQRATSFEKGDAGIWLMNFGTLVGCTAYSIYKQTHLARAHVLSKLVMVGCTGGGGGRAKKAGLAKLNSQKSGRVTLIGCTGRVDRVGTPDVLQIGQKSAAGHFDSRWDGGNLLRLGEHRLWVDAGGGLRIKRGDPLSDTDGTPLRNGGSPG